MRYARPLATRGSRVARPCRRRPFDEERNQVLGSGEDEDVRLVVVRYRGSPFSVFRVIAGSRRLQPSPNGPLPDAGVVREGELRTEPGAPGRREIGTLIDPLPVTGFAPNFSPIPRIAALGQADLGSRDPEIVLCGRTALRRDRLTCLGGRLRRRALLRRRCEYLTPAPRFTSPPSLPRLESAVHDRAMAVMAFESFDNLRDLIERLESGHGTPSLLAPRNCILLNESSHLVKFPTCSRSKSRAA